LGATSVCAPAIPRFHLWACQAMLVGGFLSVCLSHSQVPSRGLSGYAGWGLPQCVPQPSPGSISGLVWLCLLGASSVCVSAIPRFHLGACLAMLVGGFLSVCPSHPHVPSQGLSGYACWGLPQCVPQPSPGSISGLVWLCLLGASSVVSVCAPAIPIFFFENVSQNAHLRSY
jgi:putative effector of murein hydrolase LrgA (UPF0299 family)